MVLAQGRLPLQDALLQLVGVDHPAQVLHRRRGGAAADPHPGAGRVQHADRLVGQLPGRNVAVAQAHRLAHRVVEDAHPVVLLQLGRYAAHDRDRRRLVRLLDLDHLEAAGQGRVLLEVLLVLGPGGGRHRAQLAAGQGRLQQVGRVVLALLAARADQGVGLVDEQDDGRRRRAHLLDHLLEPVLELALHPGAGLQQAQVQAAQGDVLQDRRHVAGDDAQGEALDHRGLADARLAGEDRVVLPPAGQDVDDLTDLRIATQHRIDLAGPRLGGQIDGELVQRGCRAPAALARLAQLAAGRRVGAEDLAVLGRAGDDPRHAFHQLVHRHVLQVRAAFQQLPAQGAVAQAGQEQRPRAHPRGLVVDRCQQPGLAHHVLDGGRELGLAAVAALVLVEPALQVRAGPGPGRRRHGATAAGCRRRCAPAAWPASAPSPRRSWSATGRAPRPPPGRAGWSRSACRSGTSDRCASVILSKAAPAIGTVHRFTRGRRRPPARPTTITSATVPAASPRSQVDQPSHGTP